MGFVSSKIRSTEFIGPLTGTADTASFALTSSFLSGSAETASFALTASYLSGSVDTASFALTASYFSGSVESASFAQTASYLSGSAETASFALTASFLSGSVETASFALTASYLSGSAETASFALTSSYLSGSAETASFALTSSYLSGSAETASFALTASFLSGSVESASYAATASYSDDFKVNNNLIVYGTASFNYLTSIYETSSIIYSSGSTKFGDTFDDTHEFTGSVLITGSLEAQNITGSLFGTASFALTASYLSGSAETASFALTASFLSGSAISASFAQTASFLSGSVESASFAQTASYLLFNDNDFEVHVSIDNGVDEIGNGTLLYPYKTINYALTRIGTSSGRRLIIHRGQYAENLNLTATNMHLVGYNSGNGSLVEINGTVTVAASSSSTRISNIRVNALRHTGVGTLFVDQVSCTTSASFGSGYAEVIDSRFECPSGVLHTAGTLLVFGSTFSPLTTSGSTATSYLKDCIGITQPTLTAGSLIIQNCQVTSIVAGTPAINTAANTFLSLINSQISTSTGVPTRIAVGGFLSYDNIIFDKDNSILGTPSSLTARFQTIDSNIINVSGSLGVSGSINVRNGGITGSLFGTASFANFAQTASFLSGSVESASFAQTASYLSGSVETASYALTASYLSGSVETASYALTASYFSGSIETASFALTASFLSGSIESASFAATSSFLEHISNVNEVHVCTNKGEDEIGNGTLLYPYKTINYALTRIGTTPNIRLIIHNGTYVENITINTPDISIISYNGDKESLVTISGDVNTDIPSDKFVRISNIKITRLTTSGGNSFFNGINVTSQSQLQSTTEITDSKFDCPLGMVHTGGDLYIYRSEISNLTTNRLTFLKDCSNIRHLSISGSSEVDITNCKITRTVGQYAINTSNQSFLTIRNSQIESGIGTRGAINIQGAISYEDLIFNKDNSILGTTGSLSNLAPTTARFQNIDANLITVSGSLNITGSVNITGGGLVGTSSYALTASFLDGFIESASFAETASYALTASFLDGFIESASYSSTSSFAETASYALTASYLSGSISFDSSSFATTGSNTFTGSQVISGSLDISGSLFVNGVNITGEGSNSGGMLLTGSQTLTQQNPFLAITVNNTPNNRAVIVDYHLYSTTGSYSARVGTIMSAWSDVDDDVVFNEVTTNDLGDTSEIVFQAGSMNNGEDWFVINTNPTISRTYEVKYSYRLL